MPRLAVDSRTYANRTHSHSLKGHWWSVFGNVITKSAFLHIDIGKGQPVQPVYVFVFIYMSVYAVLLVKYYIHIVFILVVLSLPYLSSHVTETGARSFYNLSVICQYCVRCTMHSFIYIPRTRFYEVRCKGYLLDSPSWSQDESMYRARLLSQQYPQSGVRTIAQGIRIYWVHLPEAKTRA